MAKKKKQIEEGGIAVIYARYSSNNQREESIEQQVNKCQEFAARKKLQVVHVYSDAAISGKTDQRPQFQQMLKDSEKGRFQYVISWKSNRIGRNMLQALTNMARLDDAGVKCLFVEEYFEDTASGRFAERNMMNINQFYIENMAEDIRRGLMDNAEKCLVNTRPCLGYKKGPDKKYAINEETAPIVREIFQRYLDGWNFIDIANDLNRRGIKTVLGNDWNKGSFHSMLRNEMYVGVYKYAEVRIEGGVPAIIDKKQFEEVQRRLSTKQGPKGKKNGTAQYLLTGKLFCGHCGEPMVGISGTGRHGETHYYYRCQGRHYLKNGCDKKNAPRDLVEDKVVELISEFIQNDGLIDLIIEAYHRFLEDARANSELAAMEEELAQNKKSSANLLKALETGRASDVITNRIAELADERKQLEMEIEFEKASLIEVTPEQLTFFFERLKNGNFKDKTVRRDLIDLLVQKVFLFDNRIKIVFNFDKDTKDHEITFDQISGEDPPGAIGLYQLPSSVLPMDDTNPLTLAIFAYGLVLSATF